MARTGMGTAFAFALAAPAGVRLRDRAEGVMEGATLAAGVTMRGSCLGNRTALGRGVRDRARLAAEPRADARLPTALILSR